MAVLALWRFKQSVWHRAFERSRYRFQIRAATQPGETIALVGSILEMGVWNEAKCVHLQTDRDRYPLWWVDLDLSRVEPEKFNDPSQLSQPAHQVEYKYVRLGINGNVTWKSFAANRWVPIVSLGVTTSN